MRYGSPIIITSSYRHNECNKKAGGSRYSQHKAGSAVDLKFTKRLAHETFLRDMKDFKYNNYERFIVKILKNGKVGAVGLYNTHIHIDTRKGDFLVFDKTGALTEEGEDIECGL